MSLFRKPTKKIQRRQFGSDDVEDGEPEVPPPPLISRQAKENKPIKSKTLLSFADEEEEEEEFKVKKSSQSKRLAKKRDKEKKRAVEDDTKVENGHEETVPETNNSPKQGKKKVTLEGLILSGRAALAADGAGDMSDEEEAEEPEEDGHGFHRYRAESVRAALAAGDAIPDAALIHAARKTRQQARELGGGGDFIPIRADNGTKKGSRLVRDDDDDDEEGRIHVRGLDLPSDKPKRETEAASDAELDSEGEGWAEQQLQKAVPALEHVIGDLEMNPFSVAPPPPRLEEAPAHLRPLAPSGAAPSTAQDLVNALRNRLQDLILVKEENASKRQELEDRILVATQTKSSRSERCAALDAAYRRAQAARGYCTDLMECLDEKMPALEALERRALELHRKRCEFLQERRRADTRDQAQDVLALAARPGVTRAPDPEDKIRRTAEREGRRRARRLKREAAGGAGGAAHREGDSSDDELPPADELRHNNEAEEIRRQSAELFTDALPAFRSARGVCAALARLRRRAPRLYADAYIADCLPKLLAPYVRHQLILWNPLADEDNEDFERMDWYKELMMFGVGTIRATSSSDSDDEEPHPPLITEDSIRNDPDLFLVPTIVSRVLVPKLTELVEQAWDPLSVRACVRLRGVLMKLAALPPPRAARAALPALGAAAAARLQASLAADVFLPPLPPQIMEGGGGAFWRRCLGCGVRLLRAILALCPPPPLLTAEAIAITLIGTLSTAAGGAGGRGAAAAAAALASTLPRAPSPFRARALQRLAALAQLALRDLESDNPMHLKALEQARSVIAEAKAAEQN